MRRRIFWMALSLPLFTTQAALASDKDSTGAGSQSSLILSGLTFRASTDISSDEHCQMTEAMRDQFGATTGVRQVRIRATVNGVSHLGLCTVETDPHDEGANVVLMTPKGMKERLGTTASELTGVTVSDENANDADGVATAASSPQSANTFGVQDVREWSSRPQNSQVVFTAPHAVIELGTGEQLQHVHSTNSARDAFWIAGYRSGAGNNFAHMHISSTDLSEHSFAQLGGLFDGGTFRYAVSFHGFSDATITHDILVGGRESLVFRDGVAEILREALRAAPAPANGQALSATTEFTGNEVDLSGMQERNYVNRLAGTRGLQLEQSRRVRDTGADPSAVTYREAVADAVKSVYDCLIESPDASTTLHAAGTSATVTATSTAYSAPGGVAPLCGRWIAELDASAAAGPVNVYGAPGATCQPGASSHVDIYRRDAAGGWQRMGGGWYSQFSFLGPCSPFWSGQRKYLFVNGAQPGVFRVVIRATAPGGGVGLPQAGVYRQ